MWDATLYLARRSDADLTEEERTLLEKLEQYPERDEYRMSEREQQVRNSTRDSIVRSWARVLSHRTGRDIEQESVEQQNELVELLSISPQYATTSTVPTTTTTSASTTFALSSRFRPLRPKTG